MANTTSGLKNINLLSKTQYSSQTDPASDELWAVDIDSDAEFKDKITGYGMPDYNAVVAITSSYIAPTNGYFLCNFPQRAVGSLTINGFSTSYSYDHNYTQDTYCCYPARNGDLITFSSCTVKFVPCIGG